MHTHTLPMITTFNASVTGFYHACIVDKLSHIVRSCVSFPFFTVPDSTSDNSLLLCITENGTLQLVDRFKHCFVNFNIRFPSLCLHSFLFPLIQQTKLIYKPELGRFKWKVLVEHYCTAAVGQVCKYFFLYINFWTSPTYITCDVSS